mmetsp:Transcript_22740/g.50584  ORF Transcript_22740/g.50584 Transcript_22740/m.50584 type:complete len:478 (-) Transcript_22740:342-1775(-)|eukprot:CAMPEP_0173183548 /NCGR_PEP_ID=MMETSP1141-20130122/8453_1 /TAXON_ID=483371 /ORGANISM="non described non described, Strain CCMP2298" /LENGTH=477 /DNA_ID=CAMNT_0014106763 /DNA_START=224 /DNA_END=1657 /DNA_ORIENTATION=-
MNDKDVIAVLELLRLREQNTGGGSGGSAETEPLYRDEIIPRLMNMTLQCLGALRCLVVEQEKIRVGHDCNDIDGTCRDDGTAQRLQRELFRGAVNTLSDTIVSGQELHALDPSKDLIESFPCAYKLAEPSWLMLNFTITRDGMPPQDDEDEHFHVDTIQRVKQLFPESLLEIDKKGQHFMQYVLRTGSVALVEELLQGSRAAKFKDGMGQLPIHYCATHAQSVEMLYCIVDAMGVPAAQLMSTCYDDDGNLPLHCAALGSCSLAVLKDILFSCPDAVKVPNKEGKLPLHLAALSSSVEKLATLFSAYPHAISTPDHNGWLPLQHAAFACKSVAIVEFLCGKFPEAMRRPHQSGRLPLHYAAVTCHSSKVMGYILSQYPGAARAFDVNRRLPLHNVIARCEYMTAPRLRCLRLLLEAYPEAAGMAGKDGRTPLDIARRDGHGDLTMRLLLRADPDQDPEAFGEISYLAAKGKFKDRFE